MAHITTRILLQVFLVVLLGRPEGASFDDLGHERVWENATPVNLGLDLLGRLPLSL